MLEEQTVKTILCDNCKIKLADISNVIDSDFFTYCKKCEINKQLNQLYIPCNEPYHHIYEPYYGDPIYPYHGSRWKVNYTT